MSSKKFSGSKIQNKRGPVKPVVEEKIPSLCLHPSFGEFKRAAEKLSEGLKPLGLSIGALERALAYYMSEKQTFATDKNLLSLLDHYKDAKACWESFRDSFRASQDAQTIPSGALKKLLGTDSKESSRNDN